jgi:hypothetical protein
MPQSRSGKILIGTYCNYSQERIGNCRIGVGVITSDFNRAKQDRPAMRDGSKCLFICGNGSGKAIQDWQAVNKIQGPIRYVFEDGDRGKGLLIDAFHRSGMKTPSFEEKCSVGALQAADLSAMGAIQSDSRYR